jgi:TM2 domain-containing membrane protein YozV
MKDKIADWINAIILFFKGVDNLYLKFILTVIAIALIYIGLGIQDISENLPSTFDGYISGSVSID